MKFINTIKNKLILRLGGYTKPEYMLQPPVCIHEEKVDYVTLCSSITLPKINNSITDAQIKKKLLTDLVNSNKLDELVNLDEYFVGDDHIYEIKLNIIPNRAK